MNIYLSITIVVVSQHFQYIPPNIHSTNFNNFLHLKSGLLPDPPPVGITTVWKLCPNTFWLPTSTATVILATCHSFKKLWLKSGAIFFKVLKAIWLHHSCQNTKKIDEWESVVWENYRTQQINLFIFKMGTQQVTTTITTPNRCNFKICYFWM